MTRLSELADLVAGILAGDSALVITGAAPLAVAAQGQITLVDSPQSLEKLAASPAAAVVLKQGLGPSPIPAIEVADPHAAFAQIIRHFRPARPAPPSGIHPAAHIEPSAKIDPTATIYPFAYVGAEVEIGPGVTVHSGVHILPGCRVGAETTIHANVVMYEDTHIGQRCIVHAGTVLGANGFGYSTVKGRHVPAAQLGNVVVEDDVEIGACATIDRGAYGPTIIGEGTKIDNQVMIAHNVRLGKHNLICSQVGIAGSATTGDYVVMAGQVGVPDHVNIGAGAMLGAKAGVLSDIPAGGAYVGIPATPQKEQFRIQAALARLPELRKQVRELEKTVEQLSAAAESTPAESSDRKNPRQEAA